MNINYSFVGMNYKRKSSAPGSLVKGSCRNRKAILTEGLYLTAYQSDKIPLSDLRLTSPFNKGDKNIFTSLKETDKTVI